ncbi:MULTISPECIES: glycosyl hydrolase family 18 protein [unclassified Lysobacter]|uniref:glycosyl hydrolase family 18 protein n=1 Tax=unclassified Lysobacter TaxID=2635362 RepID=UPI000700B259|nr:chitinase [Lysobacter sp. Root76]KRD71109.1 chitinase [Lysobacter sp. Root96]
MKHARSTTLALWTCLLAASWGSNALAQSASCANIPAWNASTIYNPGDKLVYQNRLYQANIQIWNAPPTHCPSCGWYQDLGACSGGGTNQPPSVSLTSPANGGSYTTGANIAVSANASDSDGSVAQVEFFRGTVSLGVDTSSPYSVTWSNASAGSHAFKAVATDNQGASTTSATSTVTVTAPSTDTTPPSVPGGLSSPSQTSSSISLTWNASTDNSGGSGVAGYDVYRDGSLVGSPTATSYTATGLSANTAYAFRVRARDNAGNASAQSAQISASTTQGGGGGNKRVIGYFAQWGIYGRNYRVKNIDTSGSAAKITHINYAFGNVRNNRCEVGVIQPSDPNTGAGGDAFADYSKAFGAAESVSGAADTWDQPLRGNWNQLKQLKAKYPGLKVLISLGGWTWSRGFASAARPENRQAFVASCIDAYIRGNLPVTDGAGGVGAAAGVFDGIDLDWEYPAACGLTCGTPEDNANFTALLAEFRSQLNAVRPGLLLTIAAGAGVDKVRVTNPAAYHPYLDFINVMTYDFHGTWDAKTNHHSALFNSPNDPSTGDQKFYNTNDALEAFLSRGVPAAKLNLGIGFYGRGWTGVANVNNGLYQNGSAAPGTYEAGNEDYKVLKNRPGTIYTDANARATWKYDGSTFWSYDTPAMVIEKMSYVKAQNLGGAFFWEFSGDDAQGSLATAIRDGLQ